MSSDSYSEASTLDNDGSLEYRSVHVLAVLGLLLGLLSSSMLFTSGTSMEFTLLMAPLPLAGLVLSFAAWRSIAAAPELYTGALMAKLGTIFSITFLALGLGYSSYVYATEVPEGYVRTSFIDLKPTEVDKVDRRYIPEDIQGYLQDQEKVFIKGYIRPDSVLSKQNVSDFLLVRDNQECCFGDMSKVQFYDQIKVRLGPGQTTEFSRGLFRVGGVLKIGPGDPQLRTPITYYLEADYHRAPGDGPG